MDFKKSNRYNEGRPKLNVPHRGDTPRIAATTTQHNAMTHQSKRHAKKGHSRNALPIIDRLSKTPAIAQTRQFLSVKRNVVLGSVIIAVVAISFTAEIIRQHNIDGVTVSNVDPNQVVDHLEYQTVIPGGKSISDLGGWRRISPADSAPVFAYADTIDGISISVSQQPLPESFKGDTQGQLAELAKKFSATTKLDIDNSSLYVGTSAKGPQSALFAKNSLLILMKSQEKIDDSAWVKYAKSLN